ncbi:MAG: flagellar biosynthetic protein FliR [Lachnospiraceae bacterium]|nr:flagellar biosynthetic protein FliR [Lachnospiraceae bacterium]
MIDFSFSMAELEFFLMILVRVTCFIYIAPFYGMSNTPGRVKIGLGFFVSVLLYYAITPHEALQYTTLLGFTAIVLKEAAVGLIIGLGAQLCTMIVNFSGTLIDMEIGLSMMNEYDPTTKQSLSISAVYYNYLIMLMLIISGMHRYILRALMDAYTLIPVNEAVFHANRLLENMLEFMSDYLIIGFRICLPVFIVTTVVNAILGILAKVAPQMNMFAVGIQIKILVGLSVLFLTVGMLPGAADFIYTEMKRMIVGFVEALM